MGFDDEMTPEEQNRAYLDANPAAECGLWTEWVGVVCSWDKIAPPTATEWQELRRQFYPGQMPITAVATLKQLRQPKETEQ